MADTVLYFGSFNPPHNGHTEVARYVAGQPFCDELWFVVSPRNPFKDAAALAPDEDRLEMMRIAVRDELAGMPVGVCDVEFSLHRPSYTIDTLRELGRRFPERRFALLGGEDLLAGIGGWKEAETLLSEYRFYIYPRTGSELATRCRDMSGVVCLDGAPCWDFSSTDVRLRIAQGGDISGMVCSGVRSYIEKHELYG